VPTELTFEALYIF